jgi:hypothetical protein
MPPQPPPPGLISTAPRQLLEREIWLDLRQPGKALLVGGTDVLKGDWLSAGRRLSDGLLGGLGLQADACRREQPLWDEGWVRTSDPRGVKVGGTLRTPGHQTLNSKEVTER